MRRSFQFVFVAALAAALVGWIGALVAPAEAHLAIWLGVGVAFAVQIALFVLLFVLIFSSRPMMAHGLGMAGRFLAIVAIALLWIPNAELPAAPLLFSVVVVFFLTTLVEPLFLFSHTPLR